jgi:hypothetical protein
MKGKGEVALHRRRARLYRRRHHAAFDKAADCHAQGQEGRDAREDQTGLNAMAKDDEIDEISAIEARIEELAEVSERCRKIILASKVAIAAGLALLLFMMLGLFGSSQVIALGSIALILGGIVSFGSNVSTLRQTAAAISAAESLRSELIGRIDLRVVGDAPMKLM